VEENLMLQNPRDREAGIFTADELLLSIVQGIIIAGCTLLLYFYFMNNGSSIEAIRTIIFTTLIASNMFLTFANRSFTKTFYFTIRYKNNLAPFVIIISALFIATLYYVPAVKKLFQLGSISNGQFWLCMAAAFASVMWFEMYKSGLVKSKQR
jgi:Ca2+-transporting ATPase